MGAIDDVGVEDMQRPGVLSRCQISSRADADISPAILHKLLDRVATLCPQCRRLLRAAAAGLNQHVDLLQRTGSDVLRGDALELKLARAAQTLLDIIRPDVRSAAIVVDRDTKRHRGGRGLGRGRC